MKYIFYISLILSLFSCHHSTSKVETVSYEEIVIPVSYPFLNQYEGNGNIWCKNDIFFFGGYNHYLHTIDLIDLTNRKTIRSISLENQGPDGINYIQNLYIQDTLIILRNALSFLTLNEDGKITSKWEISRIKDSSANEYYSLNRGGVMLGNYRHFFYNAKDKTIFHQVYPESPEGKEHFAVLELNLNTQQYKFIPILYPSHFNPSILYSSLGSIQILKNDDSFIYSYPYSSSIFCYNSTTRELKEYHPKNAFTSNETSLDPLSMSPPEKMKYELNCLRFEPLYRIDDLNIYARIHYAPVKEGETTRKKFLTLLGPDFRVIGEYPLPDHFREKYYVAHNAIFFQIRNNPNDSEETLKMARIDLEKQIKDKS